MSHAVIPLYRETVYAKDRRNCSALFRGVRRTVRKGDARVGVVVVPDPDLPDEYELAGYWAGKDGTPWEKSHPEWRPNGLPLMRFTAYLRGTMREKREAKVQRLRELRVLKREKRALRERQLQDEAAGTVLDEKETP